ncbi:Uncharacterised protein [Serratia quinivorans]|uniref:fimbrial protein n=1 Tax=Serratia quinivorans TaxID=137545 RepID=UPI002179C32C|nr:fimbrial protein [Serratia quinivorans]CAI1724800.1 Uncharacterised protein [Serratia quinivorans]
MKASRLFKFLCGLMCCLAISSTAIAGTLSLFNNKATLGYTGTNGLMVGTGTLPGAGSGSGPYKLMGTVVLTNTSNEPLSYNVCTYVYVSTQRCTSNPKFEMISYLAGSTYYRYETTRDTNCSLENNGSNACIQSSYNAQYINGVLAGSAPKTLAPGAQAVIRVATAGKVWIPNVGLSGSVNTSNIGGAATLVVCQTTSDCYSSSSQVVMPVVFPTAPKYRTCTLSSQRLVWDLGIFTKTELPNNGSKSKIYTKPLTVACNDTNTRLSLAISGYAPDDQQTFRSTSGDAAGVTAQFFADGEQLKVGTPKIYSFSNQSKQRDYSIGVQLTRTKTLVPGIVSFVAALEITYP